MFYRLWHQLTDELEKYVDAHPDENLLSIYRDYIIPAEPHMNKMRWAKLAIAIAKTSDGFLFLRL